MCSKTSERIMYHTHMLYGISVTANKLYMAYIFKLTSTFGLEMVHMLCVTMATFVPVGGFSLLSYGCTKRTDRRTDVLQSV